MIFPNIAHNVSLQIQVAVPRISQPVASWLLKTPEKLALPKQPVMCGPLVNSWCSEVNDSSTQQWLIDIQNHPEVEEENEFEIISPRTSSGKTLRMPQVLIVYFLLMSSSVGEPEEYQWHVPIQQVSFLFLKCVLTPHQEDGKSSDEVLDLRLLPEAFYK